LASEDIVDELMTADEEVRVYLWAQLEAFERVSDETLKDPRWKGVWTRILFELVGWANAEIEAGRMNGGWKLWRYINRYRATVEMDEGMEYQAFLRFVGDVGGNRIGWRQKKASDMLLKYNPDWMEAVWADNQVIKTLCIDPVKVWGALHAAYHEPVEEKIKLFSKKRPSSK
jgi:hypothetical protein